MQGILMMHFIH